MSINDPISLQVFFWLSAGVLVTLLICGAVVGHRAAEAWGDKYLSRSKVEDAVARTAEARAREAEAGAHQADMEWQKELLSRVGEVPPVSLNIPQAQVDKLAMDSLKRRIDAIKLRIET